MTAIAPTSSRRNHERRPIQVDRLIAETNRVLRHFGVAFGPSRISRLVRRFADQVAPKGFTFADYIATQVAMSEMQRSVVTDELRRVTAYADPTGETAVNNVLRRQR